MRSYETLTGLLMKEFAEQLKYWKHQGKRRRLDPNVSHVMRREEEYVGNRVIDKEVEKRKKRGGPRRWRRDCLQIDF